MNYKCKFYYGKERSFLTEEIVYASTPFEATRKIESLYGNDKYFCWSAIPQPKPTTE